MFKKHVYTCPDVIHMRKTARNNILAQFGVVVVGVTALNVWAKIAEKREEKQLIEEHTEEPTS